MKNIQTRVIKVKTHDYMIHTLQHTGIPGLWTPELDVGLWTLSLTVVEQNQNPVSHFA